MSRWAAVVILLCSGWGVFQPGNVRAQSWLNDDFAQRRVLAGTTVEDWAEVIYGSAEPGEPLSYEHTLWWTWTAPSNGVVRLVAEATSMSFLRAECAVYTGSEFSGLSLVTQLPFVTFSGYEVAWFEATAGTSYQISVGSDWFTSFHLRMTLGPRPPNDNFAQRIHLGSGEQRVAAPPGVPSRENFEPGSPNLGTLWWSWTAPAAGPVTVTVEGIPRADVDGVEPTFRPNLWCDASVAVYAGETLGGLWRVPVLEEVAFAHPQFAQAHFRAEAGRTYQLQVATFSDTSECALVKVACTAPPAVELISPKNGQEFTGDVRLEAFASDADGSGDLAEVEFWIGPNYAFVSRVMRVDSPPFAIRTNLPGGDYWIHATATDRHGARGISESVQIQVRPANDDFARRTALSGARVRVAIPDDLRSATLEPGEAREPDGESTGSVWWSWIAPTSGIYTLEAPIVLSVFRGTSLADLNLLGTTAEGGQLTFRANAREAYAFLVHAAEPGASFEIGPGFPPQIVLVQPVAGDQLRPGMRQTVEAAAEDEDGRVARVDFYGLRWFSGETEWIGSVTNPPYVIDVEIDLYGHDAWWAVATMTTGTRPLLRRSKQRWRTCRRRTTNSLDR